MNPAIENIPQHVAIIMDGNGRWAEARGKARNHGHRRGVETVRDIIRAAGDEGIKFLTLYSFSSENWQRPKSEVKFLMSLIEAYIDGDLATLNEEGVRVKILGRRDELDASLQKKITYAEELTQNNKNLYLQIAFNYGGREELTDAIRQIAADVANGVIKETQINSELVSSYLQTASLPEPDLLIRTSGELRISNFLIWQCAYTEFYFTDVLWPDFSRADLQKALTAYAMRERRYGGVSSPITKRETA